MILTESHIRHLQQVSSLKMESCPAWIGKHPREAQPGAQYGPHNQSYVSLREKFWGRIA